MASSELRFQKIAPEDPLTLHELVCRYPVRNGSRERVCSILSNGGGEEEIFGTFPSEYIDIVAEFARQKIEEGRISPLAREYLSDRIIDISGRSIEEVSEENQHVFHLAIALLLLNDEEKGLYYRLSDLLRKVYQRDSHIKETEQRIVEVSLQIMRIPNRAAQFLIENEGTIQKEIRSITEYIQFCTGRREDFITVVLSNSPFLQEAFSILVSLHKSDRKRFRSIFSELKGLGITTLDSEERKIIVEAVSSKDSSSIVEHLKTIRQRRGIRQVGITPFLRTRVFEKNSKEEHFGIDIKKIPKSLINEVVRAIQIEGNPEDEHLIEIYTRLKEETQTEKDEEYVFRTFDIIPFLGLPETRSLLTSAKVSRDIRRAIRQLSYIPPGDLRQFISPAITLLQKYNFFVGREIKEGEFVSIFPRLEISERIYIFLISVFDRDAIFLLGEFLELLRNYRCEGSACDEELTIAFRSIFMENPERILTILKKREETLPEMVQMFCRTIYPESLSLFQDLQRLSADEDILKAFLEWSEGADKERLEAIRRIESYGKRELFLSEFPGKTLCSLVVEEAERSPLVKTDFTTYPEARVLSKIDELSERVISQAYEEIYNISSDSSALYINIRAVIARMYAHMFAGSSENQKKALGYIEKNPQSIMFLVVALQKCCAYDPNGAEYLLESIRFVLSMAFEIRFPKEGPIPGILKIPPQIIASSIIACMMEDGSEERTNFLVHTLKKNSANRPEDLFTEVKSRLSSYHEEGGGGPAAGGGGARG